MLRITRILLVAILWHTIITAFGQSPDSHQLAYHISAEGKLYWPGSQPLYLWAADGPSGADAQRLESKATSQYADPFYLDTEGLNFIRTKWAVDPQTRKPITPAKEVVFEVYKDSRPPVTIYQFANAQGATVKERQFFAGKLQLSFTSRDGMSGVKQIYVSPDGESYQPYTSPISFDADAINSYYYYAVDQVGNVETPRKVRFTVDVEAPVVSHEIKGDRSGHVYSPRSIAYLAGSDEASGLQAIYYKFDSTAFQPYGGELSLANLSDGEHTLTYYAEDLVGNRSQELSYLFYLDSEAPEVVATVVGDQYQNRGRVFVSVRTKVKLEAKDNKAGIKRLWYKIDDQPDKLYSEPFELPDDQGDHVIMYYATDKVGNDFKSLFDESKNGRQGLDIDMVAPEIGYAFHGPKVIMRDTIFIHTNTQLELQAKDANSGLKNIGFKVNGAKGKNYDSLLTFQEEGFYAIDFYGTDLVNNRNSDEFSFVVDNSGPEISTIFSSKSYGEEGNHKVYSKGVMLYLAATDAQVNTRSLAVSINGGNQQPYEKPITFDQAGKYTITVSAIDQLGNETIAKALQIMIR